MFLENLFGSTFGIIWLLVFTVAVLALLVWLVVKKDKEIIEVKVKEEEKLEKVEEVLVEEKEEEVKVHFKKEYKGFLIEENENNKFEVKKEEKNLKTFTTIDDCKMFIDVLLLREEESEKESLYEIVEIDGFFKVRKRGSDRTIRKFETIEEAEDYVREKENND